MFFRVQVLQGTGFSGSMFFMVRVQGPGPGSRVQGPDSGSRVRVQGPGSGSSVWVQGPGPGFRSSPEVVDEKKRFTVFL